MVAEIRTDVFGTTAADGKHWGEVVRGANIRLD